MKLGVRSLSEKIEAGERVVFLAFECREMRLALKAALPGNATVEISADEIRISTPRRRPLVLSRARRQWKGRRWQMGSHRGDMLVCGLARLMRLSVPTVADRLLDAAGWRQ